MHKEVITKMQCEQVNIVALKKRKFVNWQK